MCRTNMCLKWSGYVHIQQSGNVCLLTPQKERKKEKDSKRTKEAEIESGSEQKETNPDRNSPVVGVIFISVFVFHSK